MMYIVIVLLLLGLLLVYFRIADKFNIVDKPNERSSHSVITLRGGGVVIWFAALLFFLFHIKTNYLFFVGISLVAFTSFYDDISSLSNKLRAFVQFIAISLVYYDLGLFQSFAWWQIIIAYVLSVGIINAYNFMDGINGITGLYSIVVFASFFVVNKYYSAFLTDSDFIIYPILACLIFLFFNYRKKAKCFAGDVGSISIAFWVIYLLVCLILTTNSLVWLLFIAIYGVDTICTICHRLYLKQNIFKAHRLHFYQILCNEYKIDHRIVSLGYAMVQAAVSCFVIMSYEKLNSYLIGTVVLVPLLLVYVLKFKLLNNYEASNN